MIGPFLMCTTRAKNAAFTGADVEIKGFVELSMTPSNFTLMTPRGKTRLSGAPNG